MVESAAGLLAQCVADACSGNFCRGAEPSALAVPGVQHVALAILLRNTEAAEFLLSRNLVGAAPAESDWQLADARSLPLVARAIAAARPLRFTATQGLERSPDLALAQAAAALSAPAAAATATLVAWPLPAGGTCLGAVLLGCSGCSEVGTAELARRGAALLASQHSAQLRELQAVMQAALSAPGSTAAIGSSDGYSSSDDGSIEEEAEPSAGPSSHATALAHPPRGPASPAGPSSPGLFDGLHPVLLRFNDPAKEAAWEALQARGALRNDAILYAVCTASRALEYWAVPCMLLATRLPAWQLAVGVAGLLAVWPLLLLAPATYLRHRQATQVLLCLWSSAWFVVVQNHAGLCRGSAMHRFLFANRGWLGFSGFLTMVSWRQSVLAILAMMAINVAGVPPAACVASGWRAAACAASVLHAAAVTGLPLAFMWVVELRSRRLFAAQQRGAQELLGQRQDRQQQPQHQQQQQQQGRHRQDSAAAAQLAPSQPRSSRTAELVQLAGRALRRRTWAASGTVVA